MTLLLCDHNISVGNGNVYNYLSDRRSHVLHSLRKASAFVDIVKVTHLSLFAFQRKNGTFKIKIACNILKIAFETICRHISQSKFNPVGYEVTFDDDNIGCIEIKLDSGETLKLTGKIDRVDAYETEDKTYLRVIDYKTGHKIFNLNDVVHGLDIQLMVYLNALVDSSERNEYAGAFFFLLDDFFVDTDYAVPDEVIQSELIKATKLKGIIIDREDIQ